METTELKKIYALSEPDGSQYYNKFGDFLHVHSCGIASYSPYSFERKSGSPDYMVSIIAAGSLNFNTVQAGEIFTAAVGTVAVYKPHELQMLSGMSEELIRYWVHFTGYEVSEILKQCKLDDRRFYSINNVGQTEKIFLKLLAEMRSCSECKQIKLNAYLLDLLSEISRSTDNTVSKNKSVLKDKIAPAIDFLNTSYMNDISLDMLAEKCCMSKSYFINVFKEYTGYPPYEYLTNIRIENAKNLLLNTKVKVSSICCAVGIPDQNYFTKIFKRYTNTTPTAYRNSNLF